MKRIKSAAALCCAVTLLLNITAPVYAGMEGSAYRKLQDYAIFNGSGNLNWCGGDALEVANARVPIDSSVTCDGAASLRIATTAPSDNWSVRLVIRNWMSMDFSQYANEGYLEFDVKGNAGGEQFQLVLSDYDGDTAAVSVDAHTKVTADWQHVSIPLSDFVQANPDMDFRDITQLNLRNDGTTDAQKFWITNLFITSEGFEKESPHIKINQAGFPCHASKYALVSFYPECCSVDDGDTFAVCDAETGTVVYEGSLTLLSEFDARDSGEKVLKADFSDFCGTGTYYVTVGGLDDSVTFRISDDAYAEALTAAQKYFYYQRQGTTLTEEYAGVFARDTLGIDDSAVPFATGRSGVISSEKGWFDAGDSGKYVNTGAGTVSTLLWAYEMYPEQFTDSSIGIPESGNGIPDILDEARWELEWILTMQDAESGGFYPRIQGDAGDRLVMDQNGCTTDDTACAAAVLAEASLTYRAYDAGFADKCLAAAERAWNYLSAHPENIASYDVYVVSDDTADRLWAAGALYRASGNASCGDYFRENYAHIQNEFEDSYAYANGWGNNWLTGCWHYLRSDAPEDTVVQWLESELAVWRETLLTKKWENNIWGLPLHQGNYFRGITFEICTLRMKFSTSRM